MSTKTELLLEELRVLSGVLYLSDLRNTAHAPDDACRAAILAIPEERYCLAAWREAAAYVTNAPCHCADIAKAKSEILRLSTKH